MPETWVKHDRINHGETSLGWVVQFPVPSNLQVRPNGGDHLYSDA
jgi:hypothetical protein